MRLCDSELTNDNFLTQKNGANLRNILELHSSPLNIRVDVIHCTRSVKSVSSSLEWQRTASLPRSAQILRPMDGLSIFWRIFRVTHATVYRVFDEYTKNSVHVDCW